MIKLFNIILLTILCSCKHKVIYPPMKYHIGEKVLLKTGDIGVILGRAPFNCYGEGQQVRPTEYEIRVSYRIKESITDSLLEGTVHRISDIGKFYIYEYEIEKSLGNSNK